MYKIEDRGHVMRYYNAEKRSAVEKLKGEEWKTYRKLWDADISEYGVNTPPPPVAGGKLRAYFVV